MNTTKQPEALRLAEALDYMDLGRMQAEDAQKAADELRRLHSVNAMLLEALEYWMPDETMVQAPHLGEWQQHIAAIAAAKEGT